jgi:hypothetical protein
MYGTNILKYIRERGSHRDDFDVFGFPFAGRQNFGLIGPELDEFVTLYVKASLRNGCVPVDARPDENWRPTYAFGITDDEIAADMVKAWHALGRDPEWGELMFSWEEWTDPAAFAEWTARRRAAGAG